MNLQNDRTPEVAPPVLYPAASEATPAAKTSIDPAREINTRRAKVENPELLRHLRSL